MGVGLQEISYLMFSEENSKQIHLSEHCRLFSRLPSCFPAVLQGPPEFPQHTPGPVPNSFSQPPRLPLQDQWRAPPPPQERDPFFLGGKRGCGGREESCVGSCAWPRLCFIRAQPPAGASVKSVRFLCHSLPVISDAVIGHQWHLKCEDLTGRGPSSIENNEGSDLETGKTQSSFQILTPSHHL